MSVVIRAVAFANGMPCPHADQWVESFDHEAYGGQGYGTFTTDPAKAKRFADHGEAFAFWTRQSRVMPLRPDGKPNKPLTALTAVIERVENV